MRIGFEHRLGSMCCWFLSLRSDIKLAKKQTPFFATQADLISVVQELISAYKVRLVRGGTFDDPNPQLVDDINELKSCETYLLIGQGGHIEMRSIELREGGQRYSIDQLNNPDSIVLHTGGLRAGEQLIAGQIGTAVDSEGAIALYNLFVKLIRRQFEKIKSYYVGREAAAMLDSGTRLSATPKSRPDYDLVR
jgi:hypothetical protein